MLHSVTRLNPVMLKIKQLLCAAFATRDIIGSGTGRVGSWHPRYLLQAPDTLAIRHWV